MKIDQLRELTVSELQARSRELRQEILNLRIQKSIGQLENRASIKNARRLNARIQTLLSERRLNLGPAAKPPETAAPAPEKPARKKAAATAAKAPEPAPAKRKTAKKTAKKAE